MQRVYDKINYQTNFTAPKTFAILLKAIKEYGVITSEAGRNTIFPQARSKAGMKYDPKNKDTHGEISLKQYGLIQYVSQTSFKLSFLGERFLELFDNDLNVKEDNNYNYNSVMIDCLLSWKDASYGRNIHPGMLILKLLEEKKLEGYITDYEWAYICEHSNVSYDSDYFKAVEQIINFRENELQIPLKKADVFLGGFAGAWGIFYKENSDGKNKFFLTELTKENLKTKRLEYKLLKDYSLLQSEYSKLSYKGFNKIYYGTPGCGKSYKVKKLYCTPDENGTKLYTRTIFHPDYTNVDFVGQLLPIKRGQDITYEFKRGPFVEALIQAYNNPSSNVTLIIEELNRGNAAAIFGELFQLLDRDDNGDSEYGVQNYYIIDDLNKCVSRTFGYDFSEVKIPRNLSIVATMNTSDQNVYALDTAFQRRWKMEKIRNTFFKDPNFVVSMDNVDELDKKENYVSERAFFLANLFIPGTQISWREFVNEINNRIIDPVFNEYINDDKQIGIYYLGEDELVTGDENENIELKKKNFAEKMLKYIWDDIAKINPEAWFEGDIYSFDRVLESYENDQLKIFKKSIDFIEIKKMDDNND